MIYYLIGFQVWSVLLLICQKGFTSIVTNFFRKETRTMTQCVQYTRCSSDTVLSLPGFRFKNYWGIRNAKGWGWRFWWNILNCVQLLQSIVITVVISNLGYTEFSWFWRLGVCEMATAPWITWDHFCLRWWWEMTWRRFFGQCRLVYTLQCLRRLSGK